MRRLLAFTGLTVVVLAATAQISPARSVSGRSRDCGKLFSVAMGTRAARVVYRGAHKATLKDLRLLGYIERCQDNPRAQGFVRWYDHHRRAMQINRESPRADTSWYNDGGATACGFHATYGVANKSLPCGTKVAFLYNGRQATAIVDDRGPYVGDRVWDLNQNTAGALGFDGVHSVRYRIL